MNLSNGKRASSTEDINQQRKRRRTLSNDLLRGLILMPNITASQSTTSSDSSYESPISESEDDSDYGPSYTEETKENKCTKCRDSSLLLDKQNEILSLLKEIKKDNENLHKMMELQIRICRQEITEQLCDMKQSFKRMFDSWLSQSIADGNGENVHPNFMNDENINPIDDIDNEEVYR